MGAKYLRTAHHGYDDVYATPDVSMISRPLYWPQEPQM
jgi:hypothetical protein